jgi:hypothetical protein
MIRDTPTTTTTADTSAMHVALRLMSAMNEKPLQVHHIGFSYISVRIVTEMPSAVTENTMDLLKRSVDVWKRSLALLDSHKRQLTLLRLMRENGDVLSVLNYMHNATEMDSRWKTSASCCLQNLRRAQINQANFNWSDACSRQLQLLAFPHLIALALETKQNREILTKADGIKFIITGVMIPELTSRNVAAAANIQKMV